MSLDYPFLIVPSVFSSVSFSCDLCTQCWVPLDCPFWVALSVFSNVYLSCVLCTQCWQCLWIVHSWLPIRFSLTFISPMSCVLNVDSASGLPILDCPFVFLKRLFFLCLAYSMLPVSLDCPFLIAPSVFSNVYVSCVLCTQCWQCLWIVHSWLSPRFSLTFICPLSCVLNVDSFSGFSILDGPLGFHLRLFVLCLAYLMLTVPLDCPFLIIPSVFFNVYLSCVLRTQCCQCLWIVHS